MGNFSGGTSKTKSKPWGPQAAQLQRIYSMAQGLSDKPLNFYPGETVYQNPEVQQQLTRLQQRGEQGDSAGLLQGAQGLMADTVAGKYLTPESNPFLQQTYDVAARNVGESFNTQALPGLEARFGGAGRIGSSNVRSGGYQNAFTQMGGQFSDSLASLANDIFGGNYQQERNRQMAAGEMAPALAREDYVNIQASLDAAGATESRQQDRLNEKIQRFEFGQREPWERLGMYNDIITQAGVVPGTTETESKKKAWQVIVGGLFNPTSGLMGGGGGGGP